MGWEDSSIFLSACFPGENEDGAPKNALTHFGPKVSGKNMVSILPSSFFLLDDLCAPHTQYNVHDSMSPRAGFFRASPEGSSQSPKAESDLCPLAGKEENGHS